MSNFLILSRCSHYLFTNTKSYLEYEMYVNINVMIIVSSLKEVNLNTNLVCSTLLFINYLTIV